jgi:hypothetical protein
MNLGLASKIMPSKDLLNTKKKNAKPGLDKQHTDIEIGTQNEKIPDGGLLAWTQVLMGHLIIFNCWGYITS